MADKFNSIFFRVHELRGAFASLLFDEVSEGLTVQKAIDGAGVVIDPPMASIIEIVGSDTYICEAPAGTDASAPGWRCQKLSVSGGVTTTTWADGGRFSQVAANRTGLVYA